MSTMHSVDAPVFTCEVCGKAFSKLRNFRAHERRHVVPNAHTCETCGQVFLDAISLQHHQQTHSSKQVNECGVCHRLFSRKTTLDCHMRLHTNDKKFQCRMCGKSNGTKHDLLCHMRTHTGEKPFKCMICQPPTSFTTRSSLMRHTRTHSGYQPHSCKICNKTFYRKDQYSRHMYKHLEYHCLSCNSTFDTYTKYSKHLITCADSQNVISEHADDKTSMKPVNSQIDSVDENNVLLSMQFKDCGATPFESPETSVTQAFVEAGQNDYKCFPNDLTTERDGNSENRGMPPSKIVHIMVEQDPIDDDDDGNDADLSEISHLDDSSMTSSVLL